MRQVQQATKSYFLCYYMYIMFLATLYDTVFDYCSIAQQKD